MAATGTTRIYRPDPASENELNSVAGPPFAVRRLSSTRLAVAVISDIDAAQRRALGRYVERHTGISKQLVLDLRAVDLFGTDAFTALYYISVHCARNDADWMIIGSHPVRRLLSICDPKGELPLADDLPSRSRGSTASRSADHTAPAG